MQSISIQVKNSMVRIVGLDLTKPSVGAKSRVRKGEVKM